MLTENQSPRIAQPEDGASPDLLETLARRKWSVVAIMAAFALLGTIYTLWVPPRWAAHSVILLPGTRPSAAAGVAQSLGLSVGGGGDTSLEMFHRILESERLLQMVSNATNLAPKDIKKLRTIEEDVKGGVLEITVTDRDSKKALAINQQMIDGLRLIVNELMLPSKGRKAEILSHDLADKNRQLAEAEQKLEEFTRNSVTAPVQASTTSLQGSGSSGMSATGVSPAFRYRDQLTTLNQELQKINAGLLSSIDKSQKAANGKSIDFPPVAIWQTRLSEAELELASARAVYSDDTPNVKQALGNYLRIQELMQKDVHRYLSQVSNDVTGGSASLDQQRQEILAQIASLKKLVSAAPKEATEFQRLSRRVNVLSSLAMQMQLQYEQASLDKEDDPNRWEVLDAPYIEDEPVNKNYVRNVGLAALFGLAIAVFAVPRMKTR
jgi:uncharacterized protein involved in exopolysaccharide biosynthesis